MASGFSLDGSAGLGRTQPPGVAPTTAPIDGSNLPVYIGSLALALAGFAFAYIGAYFMDCYSKPIERRRRLEREIITRQHREIRKKVLEDIFPEKPYQPQLLEDQPEHTDALAPNNDSNDEENPPNNTSNKVDCAICLESLHPGDSIVHGMDCDHIFHRHCVMSWLIKNDNCPECRGKMWDPDLFSQKVYQRVEDLRSLLRAGKNIPTDLIQEVELVHLQAGREASNAQHQRETLTQQQQQQQQPELSTFPAAAAAAAAAAVGVGQFAPGTPTIDDNDNNDDDNDNDNDDNDNEDDDNNKDEQQPQKQQQPTETETITTDPKSTQESHETKE